MSVHQQGAAHAPHPATNTLSPEEAQELRDHEATIRLAETAQLDAGRALGIIKKKKLYRDRFGRFEEYCQKRWGRTSRWAYHLIGVRWVSCEPLLGPVTFTRPELVDLFVIGPQTAANGQPEVQPDRVWVEDLIAQTRRVGAAVYEKSNLRYQPIQEMPNADRVRDRHDTPTGDSAGASVSNPGDVRLDFSTSS